MCGRYVLDEPKNIYERFHLDNKINEVDLKPNYNTAPGHIMPVIIRNDKGKNNVQLMKWGLVPYWAKDVNIGFKMINARSETLSEKPSWKGLLRHKRCLIPATGFYEWKKTEKIKIPYHFHLKTREMYAFAGLYDLWKNPQTQELLSTYTIITTKPNEVTEEVHDRMPVILKKENEDFWIDSQIDDENALLEILKPYSANNMDKYEVSTEVNSPKINAEHLLNRV
jgi:putative SOS response-associated peptidase YedK